jgi:hypothetical protein
MSLNISQYPASASLAQSPMAFTVFENTAVVLSSSFQYYADLYYWTGSATGQPALPEYTLTKYPNESLYGIFDVSRIMNSTLTQLAFANTSNVKYYTVDFYWQYLDTGGYVSGSHVTTGLYKALDGYGIFQEPINQQVYSKTPYWPIMSDGPVTQSFLDTTSGWMTVYTGNVGTAQPTRMVYSGSLGNASINVSSSLSSSQQTQYFPISVGCSDFPLNPLTTYFDVQAYNGSTKLGSPIRFDYTCIQKYPNVRIKWKNRYGQFDYFNFYLVNRQGFQSTKRTYQPQIGTFQGTSLSYNSYDSSNLNYLSDSKQTLSVNSDYIDDDYNNIFKQLLVSDEIYWVYEQTSTTETVRPITIRTDSVVFKTGVNDKLVQYSFDFDWGQSYKLII